MNPGKAKARSTNRMHQFIVLFLDLHSFLAGIQVTYCFERGGIRRHGLKVDRPFAFG